MLHLLRADSHFQARILPALLLVAAFLTMTCGQVAAQPYGRGYAPPPGYEKILEDHLVLLPEDKTSLPIAWDWRAQGGVTPVKNQGSCGSCWAFAVAAEMESKIKIHYQLTLDLSEQQIISCNPYGAGCSGGWAVAAYYVLMHHGGILEHCMPYEGSDFVTCVQDDYLKFTNISSWSHVANNVTQIKTAILNNGPVSTAVDANDAWDGYTGGVITAPGSGTNHLVLIVGWDDRLGDNGAWIVKNSWGAGWGMNGYCYVAYGACNIGSGTTALSYVPPPVRAGISVPVDNGVYYGDDTITVQWFTQNEPVSHVDLWFGAAGNCQDQLVVSSLPNTGSYEWLVPNQTTNRGTLLVFPSEGTHRGFGFNAGEFRIIGSQTRYVSTAGSNTPPYDSPATAAHSIAAAVLAGAGRDSVLVAGGDYVESSITVNTQCFVVGGWSPDFSVCDPELYPTRLRGVNGAMRFAGGAGDHCGVANFTFHDSQGAVGQIPVQGRHGAAIVAVGASPLIENCRFENNRADYGTGPGWGGAIMAHGGSPVIRGCTFTGNIGSHGGAVALSACVDARIEDSLFLANATSDSTSAYLGGAIYVHGGLATITGSELRGGGAGLGGGLAIAAGAVVQAADLLIMDNRASHGGGGVHATASSFDLVRGQIDGNLNRNGAGAGVKATGGQLDLANVLIAGNEAPGLAGGIYAEDVTGTLRNNVLHANSGLFVGGVYLYTGQPFTVANNVITASTGGGFFQSGAAIDADYNLAFGNSGDDFASPMSEHDLVADPRLVDPASGDFAAGLHSPLIDSGHPDLGDDWDGSPGSRGLHGGPTALPAGPAAVAELHGMVEGETVLLNWSMVAGAATYVVYRDSAAVFVPAPELVCASLAAPQLAFQEPLHEGDWYYVVGAVDADGRAGGFSPRFEVSGGQQTAVGDGAVPVALAIASVAPNPFNPSTTVVFELPRSARASVQVFDLRGRLVAVLHEGELPAGRHQVVWNGDDGNGRQAATGIYVVRLHDGQQSRTAKAVLAK
jgi:hypothetical protein